jgi:hypothetical protein
MLELDVAFAAVSMLAVVTVAFLLRACSLTGPRRRAPKGGGRDRHGVGGQEEAVVAGKTVIAALPGLSR